jgi:hypothetical protein
MPIPKIVRPTAILGLFILFVPLLVFATPPQLEWTRTFGGSDNDFGYDAVATDDGGFLFVGKTASAGAGGDDVYMISVDEGGQVLWERTHGGAAHDVCQAVIRTDDGGFALAGYTGIPPNDYNVLLMKIDSQGNLVWQKTFGGSGEQKGQDLVQTSDGGFLICSERSFYMVRTDADGNLLYERTLGTVNDVARSLNDTPNGEFLLAGYRGTSEIVPELDARILKLNGSGSVILDLTIDTGFDDNADFAIEAANGDIVFSGGVGGAASLWRMTESGGQVWRKDFEGDWTSGILELGDGGFLFAGTNYVGENGFQVFLVKTDFGGNLIYQVYAGGPYYDWSWSLLRADDGDYVVVGSATESDGYGWDMLALRFNADAADVAAVSVPAVGTDLQLSNHPNPFNPRTTINFTTSEPGAVNLWIFDFRGRHVRTLIDRQFLPAGPQERVWDGTDDSGRPLAAGVYFSQVIAGPLTETRRMTLLK